jgi:uncharacterized membrane protein YcaP (DUF421 family)
MVEDILGLDAEELNVWHMAVRAVVVYISALLMVRIGEKRFLGKNTAFDVILGIIFGSVVSRAITGSSEFFPTLGAGLVLVVLHWLFAVLSFYSDWFGTWVKGSHRLLVENGHIQWDAMRKSHISEKDLMSALRSQANVASLEEVKEARLERSGDISVIKNGSS